MKTIWEVPVYDGAQKVWRLLNINTGTVYCLEYATEQEASAAIEHGVARAGCTVRRVTLTEVRQAVAQITADIPPE